MIDGVVALLLHSKVPVAVVDNVDVPLQLSTTVTTGVDGVVLGDAMPEPAALVQPLNNCVAV
jgi:putative N-acetylmannosamine-6-phosphate epimerase